MTTLTEFLATADADSGVALAAARALSEQVLKPISEWRNAELFADDAYGVVGVG